MISEIALQDPELVAAIYALVREAYAVEAGVIGCTDFPPLRESIGQLSASRDRFLVFREANEMVAALSFCLERNDIAINRLCVSPKHFRRGMARALLIRLEEMGASSIRVSTAQLNVPAMNLYRQLGYTLTETSDSPERIVLAHFRKILEKPAERR
jgi:ribosomal protein S18 acetylase RimI-like enzyme